LPFPLPPFFDGGVPPIDFGCTNAEGCPVGEVCCLDLTFGSGGVGTTCRAACGEGPLGGLQLCASNDECPSGERCVGQRIGLGICRRPGPGR
jgi:hypothetical protein